MKQIKLFYQKCGKPNRCQMSSHVLMDVIYCETIENRNEEVFMCFKNATHPIQPNRI